MMTVSVDSRKFNDQLSALHDALVGSGQSSDIAALIKDEARLLLKEVLKFTLPLKKNTTSDRKQGEKAVERDIYRSMRVPKEEDFKNEKVKKLIRRRDTEGFRKFVENSDKMKDWKVGTFSPDLHKAARNSRGRVTSQRKVIVLERQKVARYVKETQKRVGYMRSGWLSAARMVGLNVKTPWVARHSNRHAVAINSLTGGRPSVTIGNTTSGVGQIRQAFDRAVKTRQFKMAARTRLILSGYAKDIAAGIRPRKGVNASS